LEAFCFAEMKATVLLVDDYAGSRDSLGHTLRSWSYNVTLATNGQEALNSLRDTGFDLVVLDLENPLDSKLLPEAMERALAETAVARRQRIETGRTFSAPSACRSGTVAKPSS
jgi:CheY-like chemotaxis protein